MEEIRASDFPSGGYVRGAMARLFDVYDGIDEDALFAAMYEYDDDEYEDPLAQAGHRRSSKRAWTSEATLQAAEPAGGDGGPLARGGGLRRLPAELLR